MRELILPFLKPIEHLILDDAITEVMVNGSERVFVEKNGVLEEIRGLPLDEKTLMIAVKNIARRLGDDISEAKPILDSRLPDGSRLAAVIPPCSVKGVTLTIRKFSSRHFTVNDLIEAGTLERWLVNLLEDYVLRRANIIISGGTGTGKTTLLDVLAKFIPEDERILVIDDSSEIRIAHENLVRLEARQGQNGLPEVTTRELLRAALWHHPDRIILGEVRGQEAYELLQLSDMGQSGGLSTMHAPSPKQALARLLHCVLQSGADLSYKAMKTSMGRSVNVVIQLERRPGRRFPRSWKLGVLTRMLTNLIRRQSLQPRGNCHESRFITRNQRSDNYSWKVRGGSHDSRANCLQGGVAMSAGRTQDTLGPFAVRSPSHVDPAQLLTLAELAERLKVSERWVYEKSRRRCLTPLPCIRIGRYLRFDWTSVSAWLRQQERGA